MPSQEEQMLADFLLAPAALRDFMTLRQFTDIFPTAHRATPAVRDLYRELQRLREKDMEAVRRDISSEVRRSTQLKRDYAEERRRLDGATAAGLDLIERLTEEELSDNDPKGRRNPHTRLSIRTCIDDACKALESQIAEIENDNSIALSQVQDLVGALSDLRQGNFAQSISGEDMGEEVLATLRRLDAACSKQVH